MAKSLAYFLKLIQYFKSYRNGQLIFSSRNLLTMNLIKTRKESVFVICSDSSVEGYEKGRGKIPSELYKKIDLMRNLKHFV